MAFVTVNGYDVEHASSLLVFENLYPEIQHINGKGVTDKYTKTEDVRSVTYIDVMRVLPWAPDFRQVGSLNNGKWHNANNIGGINNAAQSEHYTVPVDLWYDRGVPILSTQVYSNPVQLKTVIMNQLVKAIGLTINIITHAKQWLGFFRDSFSDSPTAGEIADSVFAYTEANAADVSGSAVDAFIAANTVLTDGIPSIGAFVVPMEERQAFISGNFDRIMKRQYMTNASEAAAKILATGYINPFTGAEAKINPATGLAGEYDGIPMFLINRVTREFVYLALNIPRNLSTLYASVKVGADLSKLAVNKATFESEITESGKYEFIYDSTATSWELDGTAVLLATYGISVTGTPSNADKIEVLYSTVNAVALLLDKIQAIVVYGAGTVRGIVGPTIEVNKQVTNSGVYVVPQLKLGVEVLDGRTIKVITSSALSAADITLIKETLVFTPINGKDSTIEGLFGSGVFNDGTSN